MADSERLQRLSELLRRHEAARVLAAAPVWGELWDELEQELLERLLQCDATEDTRRFRLQTAISVARDLRRMVEHRSVTPADLEREIGFLDGSKVRPIA